jgi:hypothetical protein
MDKEDEEEQDFGTIGNQSMNSTKDQPFFMKKANPNGGPMLREFEAIDLIHERMRHKTDEGLNKLESLIKKQLH